MLAIEERTRRDAGRRHEAPALHNGDRLRAQEFLRRYEAMPELKKAELIEGTVYMGSPVRAEEHGEPEALIHTWLGTYAANTPGVRVFANTTVVLDADNTPQPDACLCLKPGRGGGTRIGPKKYLVGPPELIVEIAASSASIDLHDKMDAYARNGVAEYLVWRTLERRFDWFALENENYVAVPPDAHGLVRSRTFPGLVLALSSLLAMNAPKVLAAVHKAFVADIR